PSEELAGARVRLSGLSGLVAEGEDLSTQEMKLRTPVGRAAQRHQRPLRAREVLARERVARRREGIARSQRVQQVEGVVLAEIAEQHPPGIRELHVVPP